MRTTTQRRCAVTLVATVAGLGACGGGSSSGGDTEVTSQLRLLGNCTYLGLASNTPAGTTTNCSIQLFNKGAGASRASTLSLSAMAPLQLAGVSCSASGADALLCPAAPGASNRLPALPPGTQLSFTLDLAVPEGSNGTLHASAQLDEDNTLPNDSSQAVVFLNVFWTDLAVALAVDAQSVAGGEVVFTATLVNRGAGTYSLPGYPVRLQLPAGLSTTDPITTPCVSANSVYCSNFSNPRDGGWGLIIGPFDTQTYTYRVALPADYRGDLTAVFTAPTAGDPVTSNNAASASTQVVAGP